MGRRVRGFLLVLALVSFSVQAQSYPQRPVRLIVPFAPGGTTDALGRVLAVALGERLGQQLVVENRPGGGGTLGAEAGARAQPDGYTLLLGSAESFGMTEGTRKRLTYDPERDLVPVAMVARAPNTFIVHPSVQVSSLDELIEYARRNPGKLRYGSPGIGSNPHLIGELFASRYKLAMIHVPYVKGGQVRALAVTGGTRTPLMPDVPTMAEAGTRDFVLGALFGVFVPRGTPQEAIARLTKEVPAVTQNAEFRKRVIDVGQEVTESLLGEAFGRYIRAEAQRWRELAAVAGVKEE
jgi:tripartite-type tricarboxylate transporter receptor subunit TctC